MLILYWTSKKHSVKISKMVFWTNGAISKPIQSFDLLNMCHKSFLRLQATYEALSEWVPEIVLREDKSHKPGLTMSDPS